MIYLDGLSSSSMPPDLAPGGIELEDNPSYSYGTK